MPSRSLPALQMITESGLSVRQKPNYHFLPTMSRGTLYIRYPVPFSSLQRDGRPAYLDTLKRKCRSVLDALTGIEFATVDTFAPVAAPEKSRNIGPWNVSRNRETGSTDAGIRPVAIGGGNGHSDSTVTQTRQSRRVCSSLCGGCGRLEIRRGIHAVHYVRHSQLHRRSLRPGYPFRL